MKIRISGDTLQFRLSNFDLDQLEELRRIETRLVIGSNLSWSFALSIANTIQNGEIIANLNQLELQLPLAAFASWNLSHEIEWKISIPESPLIFMIEKDLKDKRSR